ncbi:MAG: glutathione transferase [bacterium]|nr:glutathione transferase [bacterium]
MLEGLNHITLSVSDLDVSFRFYTHILGFKPKAKWDRGAYLELGRLWLCLTLDKAVSTATHDEYTHIAFSSSEENFECISRQLLDSGAAVWKENASEGNSLYILDPDGHKLEIHVGSLKSRLDSLKKEPCNDLEIFE